GRVHLGAAIERRGAAPRILPDGRRFGAHFFTAFPRFGYPTRTPDIAGGSTALTLRAAPPRQGQHARADHAKFVICDHTIEDAFNVVKRLLGLAYFWTGSENGVTVQLWATWLLYAVL